MPCRPAKCSGVSCWWLSPYDKFGSRPLRRSLLLLYNCRAAYSSPCCRCLRNLDELLPMTHCRALVPTPSYISIVEIVSLQNDKSINATVWFYNWISLNQLNLIINKEAFVKHEKAPAALRFEGVLNIIHITTRCHGQGIPRLLQGCPKPCRSPRVYTSPILTDFSDHRCTSV